MLTMFCLVCDMALRRAQTRMRMTKVSLTERIDSNLQQQQQPNPTTTTTTTTTAADKQQQQLTSTTTKNNENRE